MPTRHGAEGVQKYYPNQIPGDSELPWVLEFLRREFFAVYQGFQGIWYVEPLHVEPQKLQEGLLAYADGTDWDPGSGKGMYFYNGTAWVAMFT